MNASSDSKISWAGFSLPDDSAARAFCVLAGAGAGKALYLRSLLDSLIPGTDPLTPRRLFYVTELAEDDPALPRPEAFSNVRILDPVAPKTFAWNIGADLDNAKEADAYAGCLLPDAAGGSGFFVYAARTILAAALRTLIRSNTRWNLQTLIDLATNWEKLKASLQLHGDTCTIFDAFSAGDDTFRSILATLADAMLRFEPIADAAHLVPPERQVSLHHWHQHESSVLVLRHNPEPAAQQYNQLLINTLLQSLLAATDSENAGITWIVLPQVDAMSKIAMLPYALAMGRAKGIRIAFAIREIERLRNLYGSQAANELIGNCSHVSILRLDDHSTAELARKLCAGVKHYVAHPSKPLPRTIDPQFLQNALFDGALIPRGDYLTVHFMELPIPRDGVVTGIHILPEVGGAILRETQHTVD